MDLFTKTNTGTGTVNDDKSMWLFFLGFSTDPPGSSLADCPDDSTWMGCYEATSFGETGDEWSPRNSPFRVDKDGDSVTWKSGTYDALSITTVTTPEPATTSLWERASCASFSLPRERRMPKLEKTLRRFAEVARRVLRMALN